MGERERDKVKKKKRGSEREEERKNYSAFWLYQNSFPSL